MKSKDLKYIKFVFVILGENIIKTRRYFSPRILLENIFLVVENFIEKRNCTAVFNGSYDGSRKGDTIRSRNTFSETTDGFKAFTTSTRKIIRLWYRVRKKLVRILPTSGARK